MFHCKFLLFYMPSNWCLCDYSSHLFTFSDKFHPQVLDHVYGERTWTRIQVCHCMIKCKYFMSLLVYTDLWATGDQHQPCVLLLYNTIKIVLQDLVTRRTFQTLHTKMVLNRLLNHTFKCIIIQCVLNEQCVYSIYTECNSKEDERNTFASNAEIVYIP